MENDSIPVSKQSTYRNKMQMMNISAEVTSPKNLLTQQKAPMMDTTSFGPTRQKSMRTSQNIMSPPMTIKSMNTKPKLIVKLAKVSLNVSPDQKKQEFNYGTVSFR